MAWLSCLFVACVKDGIQRLCNIWALKKLLIIQRIRFIAGTLALPVLRDFSHFRIATGYDPETLDYLAQAFRTRYL